MKFTLKGSYYLSTKSKRIRKRHTVCYITYWIGKITEIECVSLTSVWMLSKQTYSSTATDFLFIFIFCAFPFVLYFAVMMFRSKVFGIFTTTTEKLVNKINTFHILNGMSFAKEAKPKCKQNKTKRKSRLSLLSTSSKSLISEICYDNNSNKFVRAYEIRIKYSTTQLLTVHIGIQFWQNVAILGFSYWFWIIYVDVDLSLYRSLSFIFHCSIAYMYLMVYKEYRILTYSCYSHSMCLCVCRQFQTHRNSYETFTK